MRTPQQTIYLIYDGDCPICSRSALAVKLKEAVGSLQLINAREQHPLVAEVQTQNFDLNQGMVVKYQNQFYHGADALHLLALLGSKINWFNRLNVLLFRSKFLSKILYPCFRLFRNFMLSLKGASQFPTHKNKEPIFKAIFAQEWNMLPKVMKKHYRNKAYSNDVTTAKGHMNVRYSKILILLLPAFRLLGVLVPYSGENIPVEVHYRSSPDTKAFHFDRVFYFPNKKPYHFRSKMLQMHGNVVIEFMRFGLGWRMKYLYDGKKVILQHYGYRQKIFRWVIPLPLSLLIGKGHAEEYAIDENTFRMKMTIKHRLFGELFTYSGTFTIETDHE